MNKNSYGVIKINECSLAAENAATVNFPEGFIVREKLIDGRPVNLEYGIYLSEDIFLGVPVHYNLKNKLLAYSETPEYNYFMVPQLMQFAVSTYMNKRTNKLNPILVEPTEKKPAMLVSSFAFRDNINSVANIKILDENTLVLRKYIDKDRMAVGLILVNINFEAINPSTKIEVEYGILGSNRVNSSKYEFNPMIDGGIHKETLVGELSNDTLKTEFINLPTFIRPKQKHNNNKQVGDNKRPTEKRNAVEK